MLPKSISVIVPAYNEERTIEKIIKVLLTYPGLEEIICVNDGSTDNTLNVLRRYENEIKLIDLKKNTGKGNALAKGIEIAKGDILIFLDADHITLSHKHITLLLEPILNQEYKAVLGYSVGNSGLSLASNITGQRAYYRKDLLPHLEEMSKSKYGIEMFLNSLFKKKDTKKVVLPGLKGLQKYQKRNTEDTVKEYFKEGVEIAKVVGNRKVVFPTNMIMDRVKKLRE
jgi:glycosyltransferase involved in cell wall biosynthesis